MTLAEDLWRARSGGTKVAVAAAARPATDADAYAIQLAVSELAGSAVRGWKVGATAPAAMALLGVDEPFYGPLYERYCHRSGDGVAIVPAHGAAVEAEFAVGLGRDLPGRDAPYTRAEVEPAVAWIAPALEVVGSRLEGGLAGAGRMVIADGGANVDFVQGEPVAAWRDFDLSRHPVVLYVNGEEVARGHSGTLMFGHTLGSVAWLACCPSMQGRGLKAGDVITTGTCTGVTPVAPGDEVRADYGALGEASARFVAA